MRVPEPAKHGTGQRRGRNAAASPMLQKHHDGHPRVALRCETDKPGMRPVLLAGLGRAGLAGDADAGHARQTPGAGIGVDRLIQAFTDRLKIRGRDAQRRR